MRIRVFELERVQSLYENTVDFNLTESGFHPLKLNEFLSSQQIGELANISLGYGQTNGSLAVRERIADLHPGQTQGNVLVANGSSEANFVACHTLLDPGDEVVMMVPNYMQIWGIAEEMGAKLKGFHLREENNWAPDLDELRSLVTDKTKMIVVCNPNNPTGYTLTHDEMKTVVDIAESVDAWVYADEVYRGAELDSVERLSFIGMYAKAMVCGGLSKAYALPGLRLGWLVGPQETIANSWAYHDYTSITAGILSHHIGEIVLAPENRLKILERNRSMLRRNLKTVAAWADSHKKWLHFIPPKAGGMAFMRYDFDINSGTLAHRLRKEKSVFLLAGDCFGMDHYFRMGIGADPAFLEQGILRLDKGLRTILGV